MSKLNKKSTLNILNLKTELKALRYIKITTQIKEMTAVRSLLKDELIPILEKCPNKLKNFKGVPTRVVGKPQGSTVDFFLELLEKDVNRFDTTAFKKAEPKIYTQYLKASKSIELKGKLLS
mgnify:FL=1